MNSIHDIIISVETREWRNWQTHQT